MRKVHLGIKVRALIRPYGAFSLLVFTSMRLRVLLGSRLIVDALRPS